MPMNRVIRVSTPAGVGATYIPIDRSTQTLTIQAIAVGTVTYTVDYTLDNIRRGLANPYDNSEDLVAAASADWTNLIASGSASTSFNSTATMMALRVNITAGTGNVRILISQGE